MNKLTGLAAHVRPVFMVPVIGISVCGSLLAPEVDVQLAAMHATGAGIALFVAHLRDGLVDGHVRGEEQPVLSIPAYRWTTAAATLVALLFAVALFTTVSVLAAGSITVLLCLALLHAPYLDRHPVPVTVDYPVGIAVTLAGGFATQTGTLPVDVLAAAVSMAMLLSGIKVGIDQLDAAFDRTIGKHTVPVIAGGTGAQRVAASVFAGAALFVAGFVVTGILPVVASIGAVAAIGCAGATLTVPPRTAVRLQMALSYVFAGALFAALCGRYCAGWAVANQLIPLSTIGQVQFDFVSSGP
jgi:4-hydroxybenzoate polyprenyltransferase